MQILTKLTKRNLILNKKRTIGTIIGIVSYYVFNIIQENLLYIIY